MKKLGFWAGLFLFVLSVNLFAQGVPAPLTVRLQPYLTGLSAPVLIRSAKDGTGRLFVVQQGGIIKVVQPGSNVATDFMNITTKVLSGGERGLLGLTFHPNFAQNSYFFVNYTRQTDGATIVARYTATNGNTLGDPNSERILLTIAQPFSNHNGGMIEFRTDNGAHNLYIGMGDGGSGNDPGNRSQNINELLGKFLRITPDVSGSPTAPAYSVPADNPYVGVAGADEIYSIGVRNPWRWSFDRGGTNQLWAGDVGQGSIEEVDIITRGGNFGWRVYEGTQCTNLDPGLCTPGNYIAPVFQYSSASPSARCSITGGYVYRGARKTLPDGSYVYGDYCTGEILLWNNNQQTLLLDSPRSITSFGEDDDGEIYVVGQGGTIEKIVRAKASADFDGDLRTDVSIFRPSNGAWYINHSSNNTYRIQGFGLNGDVPVPEDYDGDNITDIGVFRPSNGTWYHYLSSTNTVGIIQFGANGDTPAAGDYDGDGKADFAIFRASEGTWYRNNTSTGATVIEQFGLNGDIPTPGDYDGDGKTDVSVWRPANGTWYRRNSTNPTFVGSVTFGASGDVPVQGDFDGDYKTDQAVFRNGVWYVLNSSNNSVAITNWGLAGDIPVVGDYDGDNREDVGVFRPADGVWYIIRSSNGSFLFTQFGLNGDLPAPRYDAPY
jgi:glucose/arabinose dehydrogenase